MTVTLNHTIIAAHDKDKSATFLTEILGLPPHTHFSHFAVVQVGDTSLDYTDSSEKIVGRHFAFMVSEPEFDDIFGRITERGLTYWADPLRKKCNQMNHRDDGRGLYFEDPDGHLLEILTRPYGSGAEGA